MSKVKVSKIKIELGKDQVIELTMEQARELQEVLNETLGKRETVVVRDPVIIDRYPRWYPPYTYWTISDSGTTSSGTSWQGATGSTITYSLKDINS